ncbi:MAG: VOC family protein [Acinetobacter populi]|uniref:VOC family protein n=1 Tax=Acinetobacter populi TaxID=1582270 RepID=UPI002354B2DE|nr:VOC family protein [Acinetobacter populi]MCH4246962.1 VOC family protein [Acinetobacter populi]
MTQATIALNYVEFKVKNIARSKAFYQKFGWTFTDYGEQYCEFNDGQLKGGFALAETIQVQGGVLLVLYSQNIEEAQQIIQQAGGTITQDIYDFPGGRRFHFQDPDGYELAVWSDKN